MARNDVYLNINALSPADAVVTGQQDMTAATVPELVLGDTPTFNFYFTDNTNVWPSWAGNASYTLTWALSDAVAGDFAPAATTGNATPITGGWSVVLPLNAYDLVGLLNTKRVSQPYPVTNLWQQIRVADPSGNEITRAMFWTPIRYRAISDTQNTESASPTGGREVTVDNVNVLTTPTAAQFYAANPVPTSALGSAANGELLIGNGTGFTKATLTAGSGVSITNGSGSITISATDGDITLDDGTAAAPSLKFTADPDTGLFRPSDNVVGISAGGVSRATFGATSAINGTTIPGSKTLVVTTDKLSALAATTSAELAGVISDETGSGALVFATSPTLTTPILGTPQSGTLSSCTGLPISSGVSGLGTNVATFLATPSSANLASAVTDETGTGALVFANTPTLVTPNIGAATGTSVNLSGAGTFGGNLTVSGTGTHSFAGRVWAGSGSFNAGLSNGNTFVGYGGSGNDSTLGLVSDGASRYNKIQFGDGANGSRVVLSQGNASSQLDVTASTLALTGNLTVSGTGTSSFGGKIRSSAATATGYNQLYDTTGITTGRGAFAITSTGAGLALGIEASVGGTSFTGSTAYASYFGTTTATPIHFVTNAAISATLTSGGNFLLGTTIDGGQKLQVSGSASFAGSIAGTSAALTLTTTASNSNFRIDAIPSGTATSASAVFYNNSAAGSAQYGRIGMLNGTNNVNMVVGTGANSGVAGSLILQTAGTDALTLDSSQNATFAGTGINSFKGTLTLNKSGGAILNLNSTTDTPGVQFAANTSRQIEIYTNVGVASKKTLIDENGDVTLVGKITTSAPTGGAGAWKLGVANTVSPTAPNRTITIEIGGTVYYLHAKTTND